jgi:uncharacterized protein YicC (UPF0701 family)
MAKVKVSDVFYTRKQLTRLENYSRNHMDNLPIAEMNEKVAEARALLAANVDAFDDMDVATLTVDTSDIQEQIDRLKSHRKDYKENIAATEQDIVDMVQEARDEGYEANTEWEESRVERYKEYRKAAKVQIRELKAQL